MERAKHAFRGEGGMHVRAAIYARMSTDKQSEALPEDKVADVPLCGAHVVEVAQACGFEGPRPGSVREVVR